MPDNRCPPIGQDSERQRMQRAAFARGATAEDRAALAAFERAAQEHRSESPLPADTASDSQPITPALPARSKRSSRQSPRSVAFAALTVVAALAGFSAGAAYARSSEGSAVPSSHQRNEYGLTYGPINEGETQPDLIAITTVNGEDGYAYYIQVFGQTPLTPEEAEARPDKTKEVPVYLSDGVSQIGYAFVN